jgi:ATP/maltotriose-dependent transcriptional regulator MalT
VVDLVEAEVALRDGAFSLAGEIAERVIDRLPAEDGLRSRSHAIVAQSAYIRGDLKTAELAFERAHRDAREDSDAAEALYGWALASLQGEQGDATWIMSELAKRRHHSPLDLLRHATAQIVRRHFSEGFAKGVPIDEGRHVFDQVDDPRARSSFNAIGAYCLALAGDYAAASALIQSALDEIDAYDLDFARPHAWWTRAFIELGQRRFGACERALQRVEDAARDRPVEYHILNARILRTRLALQTAQVAVAKNLAMLPATEAAIPSIHAEYHGTRALVFASTGELDAAIEAAASAESMSTAVETRVLAQAARSIVEVERGDAAGAERLWHLSAVLGTWDPLIAGSRASRKLANALSDLPHARPRLAALYQSSRDLGLARHAGLRTRNTRKPEQLLTPREFEVLELLARGFRNKDVSDALVIAPSTTKVHVRNILEKLGVHTRTEAVARFTAGL